MTALPAPWVALLLATLAAGTAAATDPNALAGTETESPRAPARLLEAPLSISVLSGEEVTRGRTAFDLEEALELVPGVFAQSARNGAQDARFSIRGYGARASFGIRGVRLLVDGFPTTLPDGQSDVDSIDLAFADRIEVVRGPISSLYGGGGGGIVAIETPAPTEEPRLALRSVVGSYHLFKHEGLATGRVGDVGYSLGLAHSGWAGYRDHSRSRQTNLHSRFERELSDGTRLGLFFSGVGAPEAQDPGGLTAAEVDADRKQSAASARLFDTGERLDQSRVGVALVHPLSEGQELEARGYWLERNFENALPFFSSGRVNLDRGVWGGSLVYRAERGALRFAGGTDFDFQSDHRRRFDNVGGHWGANIVDQSETVRAVGIFSELHRELGAGFGATAGARWDWTEFVVGDRIAFPDDASSRIRMRELSPRIGLDWGTPRLRVYSNLATAFQVPTTTEFAPAASQRGFDPSLDPEKTLGLELGAKGLVGRRLLFEAAVFDLHVRDAIVPFQDPGGQQRARNAASARRRGFELGLSTLLHPWWSARAAYTFAHYRYVDFDVVDAAGNVVESDGHREPNVPVHSLGAELRFDHPSGVFAVLGFRHYSDVEVNDGNTLESNGATLSDLRAGITLQRGVLELEPFAGVRNWTNVEYDGTLRPNANAGRYFEPAPRAELFAGIALRLAATHPAPRSAP